mmetsp:Transcript_23780/g.66798  ORF Transcript_23780/g.66798 Transcript_23780/m.66798 type:complete len:238 (-) Transcript_23780:742-1455(-)
MLLSASMRFRDATPSCLTSSITTGFALASTSKMPWPFALPAPHHWYSVVFDCLASVTLYCASQKVSAPGAGPKLDRLFWNLASFSSRKISSCRSFFIPSWASSRSTCCGGAGSLSAAAPTSSASRSGLSSRTSVFSVEVERKGVAIVRSLEAALLGSSQSSLGAAFSAPPLAPLLPLDGDLHLPLSHGWAMTPSICGRLLSLLRSSILMNSSHGWETLPVAGNLRGFILTSVSSLKG